MNVYDFDNTIYDGDSSVDFIFYSYKKFPFIMFKYVFKHIALLFQAKFSNKSLTKIKSSFFSYLKDIKDVDGLLDGFAKDKAKNIKKWYIDQMSKDDVIVSASPFFIVSSVLSNVTKATIIATDMNKHTGAIVGENCKGTEKVKRFKQIYSLDEIDNFYSDDLSDIHLAKFAKNSYLVKKDHIEAWSI